MLHLSQTQKMVTSLECPYFPKMPCNDNNICNLLAENVTARWCWWK